MNTTVETILDHCQPEPNSGCFLWTGRSSTKGYALMQMGRKQHTVSRVLWELLHGPLAPGIFVLHKCDNPPCLNPDHLFAGTLKDNAIDMVLKGRSPIAKLNPAKVLEIRKLLATGMAVGRLFNVNNSTVSNIKRGHRWSHVVSA